MRPRPERKRRGGRRGAPPASVRPLVPLLLGLLLLPAGCEPPDLPPALVGSLPPSAVAYLEPDRISTFQLEEGVVYRSVRSRKEPWSVHLLEVDVSRCELGFRVARAEEGEGRAPVSELARRHDVPIRVLGRVGGQVLRISQTGDALDSGDTGPAGAIELPLKEMADAWEGMDV